ncbi:MAG: hypothetical protein FRX49_02622 [Trebouxia sp. A1-2]|nr:MAG: hypothetical protein FRX49_02622 [Trebouxia sp. A1-2]
MGDDTEHKVELVRVPRQEQVYEREAVFGRDASSVFPTEGQKAAAEAKEALKSKLGANRFISETEIQELQKEYGGTGEASEPIKPLAHILLEAKQAKDEAFQNQWKQMKQGKNRPLDEEEVQFVDALEAASRDREQEQRKQELDALEAYQLAVRAAAEARQPPSDSAPDLLHQKASTKPMGPKKPPAVLKPPKAKPVFVRKRSSADAAAVQKTDQAQPALKLARLSREEHDVLSNSLPVPSSELPQAAVQSSDSFSYAGPLSNAETQNNASEGSSQPEESTKAAADNLPSVRREGEDPISTSLPPAQGNHDLSTFLAAYGSDSDSDLG